LPQPHELTPQLTKAGLSQDARLHHRLREGIVPGKHKMGFGHILILQRKPVARGLQFLHREEQRNHLLLLPAPVERGVAAEGLRILAGQHDKHVHVRPIGQIVGARAAPIQDDRRQLLAEDPADLLHIAPEQRPKIVGE
jgi:hypothetical protein